MKRFIIDEQSLSAVKKYIIESPTGNNFAAGVPISIMNMLTALPQCEEAVKGNEQK